MKFSFGSNLLPRYHTTFLGLLVLVIFIIAWWLILSPRIKEIKSGGPFDIKAKEKELKEKANELNQLSLLIKAYQRIGEEELKKIPLMLPNEPDREGLIITLETIAQKNGLSLNNITISEEVKSKEEGLIETFPAPSLKTLNIALNVSGGDYFSFKKFLTQLENNVRILDISSLNLNPEKFSYTLNLKTYYLK